LGCPFTFSITPGRGGQVGTPRPRKGLLFGWFPNEEPGGRRPLLEKNPIFGVSSRIFVWFPNEKPGGTSTLSKDKTFFYCVVFRC